MIVIIDYGLGNLASVANALNKLEIPCRISSSPLVIRKSKGTILPGVGAAGQGMKNLKQKNLDKVIIEQVKKGKPILGICLGMQLFLSFSEEGNVKCLDLIKGTVKKFKKLPISSSEVEELKIPQIGWNQIKIKKSKRLISSKCKNQSANWRIKFKNIFNNIPNRSFFYFVNSYYCEPEDNSIIAATSKYGKEFCSVLAKENLIGVQFHPEKSGKLGLQLLKNWEALC